MRVVSWLARRVGAAAILLWIVATVIFIAIRMIPGDPAEAIMGGPGSQASAEALEAAREQYHLNEPLLVQYALYLGQLITGDLGTSYAQQRPVAQIMAEMLPATLQLTLISLVIAWLIAFLMAAVAARSNRIGQAMGTVIEVVAAAVPHFWLGAMLIIIFSTWLGWLPSVDTGTVQGIILPALTLAIPLSGFLAQLMRDSLVTAMSSPFALAARARGASEGQVFFRHGFRHAALPALNLTGWAVATSISGAVVVEEVFARPGLGRSLLGAVLSRDMPMVTGIALFSALIYMVVMLIVEAIEAIINPAAARGDDA
ncbi:MAG: ABC transporter permease [Yaniella sp.]|uniref:ABC transporter permease n=1 Tax=Yaniella sp. TaxID=2773929 RepID=UPI002647945E|nr:ABC transporter permease [Yaniella sp.]MDN5730982.1 ABC transporter permease [Yaniella sp.]MDN5742379.1 ABC transporter permease [Yaniella sp.]MDN5814632.1 ABC transporter permease [Yaniella sp.]MDN5816864.1 ABC transporter permease [Yaniella sp.]MDN5837094.1 ABC transporter permease [Yaniella sp.]